MYNQTSAVALFQTDTILGLTKGWGKVVVHTDGYRVAQAEVVGLVVFKPDREKVQGLSEGWQKVPIFVVNTEDDARKLCTKFLDGENLIQIPSAEAITKGERS